MTDIIGLDATELSARLAAGQVTAEAVMEATLARIAEVNPQVTAIVSLREADDLLAEARAADQVERTGWLHGIPMAIKDLVRTQGLRTSMGSPLFADQVPDTDDGMVARLKQAGALVIGKTNVPAFGLGGHSTNPIFGVTRNPYDRTRTAGGSSGGAGAALATRMLALADGSDMMGSLRNPAAWNNVWSLRPTWGVVPSEPGADTYLHMLASLGPMARSPRDLAALLTTMAYQDPRRPYGRACPDVTGLDAPVAGMRLGWLADWGGTLPMEPGILDLCRTALTEFEALSCAVDEVTPPISRDALWHSWETLRAFAVWASLRAHWDSPSERALLNPQAQFECSLGSELSALQVQAASEIRSAWLVAVMTLFERYDALILPSAQLWPFPADWDWPRSIAGVAMDTYHRWMEVVVPASLLGLPVLGTPAGFAAAGLPMGLQLIGAPGEDGRLLRLGQAYDRRTGWVTRHPPRL